MELTIEQALQQGVAAHKEGKLQDAERLYRAILQSQPAHADANHNLGVLAVSVNKAEAALPLFKTALEANPKIEQFWLSYIDALIKTEKVDDARLVLSEAQQAGVTAAKLQIFEEKLQSELSFSSDKPEQELGNPLQGYEDELSPAIELREVGRYKEAQEWLSKFAQHNPANPEALSLLSQVLLLDKKEAEAEKVLTAATSINSELPSVYRNQARLLLKQSKTAEALEKAQLGCRQSPEDSESLLVLAACLGANQRDLEALPLIEKILKAKSNYAEAYANRAVIKLRAKDTVGAIEDAEMTVSLKPHLTQMWQLLSSLHYQANNLSDAIEALRRAHKNEPENPDFMVQLGELLRQDNKASEAINILEQVTKLAPKDAKAWTNLGVAFQQEKRVADAKIAYEKALALNPVSAAIANNLGAMAKESEEWDTALEYFGKAVEIEPNLAEAIVNLDIAIKNVKFNSSNPKLYPPLTQLLTAGNFGRPRNVAKSILSLLKQDTQIKDLLLKKNSAVSLNEATSIIKSLDKLPLLHHLMRLCPLPELQFEELFVAMRSLLLKNLDKMEVSPELIYFLSTLSIHCFTNEYVYFENDEETHLIGELQAEISQTLVQSEQPEAIKILCLASYRSLHQYDWCQKLECLDNLEEVKRRLLEEPLLEKIIAKDIPVLEEISDDVSLKVREQYEENPYPRWVKLRIEVKAKSISKLCDELKLQLHAENIKNVNAPAILIAGCGTGQHSIGTASRFSNCHVTAVDLSLASLAYAQRKSNELSFTNIDYLQADILHIHQMGKEFDIIESAGVLHHMNEPMAGWKVLVNLLKPGGLMKIGLYSKLARHNIVEIRKEITALGVGTSSTEIRKFRQSLAESHDENHQRLTESSDFFSLSTLRDLIFHVQEHRFTLPQIKNCLNELGLKFCGFENKDVISNFRELYGNEADIYDLELWHQYEERKPRAFAGMYQFWCQKP
jgi:tetratricopeptide (TPR) repeat protein/2-polyprenyl-3-methyl-5-hydroxy-6-metoxy-1,4-benzoquinol methylase